MPGATTKPRHVEDELAPGVTLWRRIADDLEQAIALGTHAAGERLPGEVEIAARFGVNRHTVRRALAELTERGLVRAERGSGTWDQRAATPAAASSPMAARPQQPTSPSGLRWRPGTRWCGSRFCAAPTGCRSA